MARYVLTGGVCAFIPGVGRVDVGEVFEYDAEKYGKPPRFSQKLEEGQPAPTPEVPPVEQPAMSEMQLGEQTKARPSDVEPVS